MTAIQKPSRECTFFDRHCLIVNAKLLSRQVLTGILYFYCWTVTVLLSESQRNLTRCSSEKVALFEVFSVKAFQALFRYIF